MQGTPVYWIDPQMENFDVTLNSLTRDGSRFLIGIEESVIRPSGGGQAGDKGTLMIDDEKIAIVDTVRGDDGLLLVSEKQPKDIKGRTAKLSIDMTWRKSMMKNHSGEHIFVRALTNLVEEATVGKIWIDGIHGSVEVKGKGITEENLLDAEERVNRLIQKGLDIRTKIVDAEELDESVRAREGVTSRNEKLRIVEVEGFDESACSGIHVGNTKDLLLFKMVDYSIEEEKAHIEFLTGWNAIRHLIEIYNLALTRKFSYPFQMEQLGAILDKSKTTRQNQELLAKRLMEVLPNGPTMEEIGDIKFQAEYLPGFDNAMMKQFVKMSKMKGPTVLLLVSPGEKMHLMLRTHKMANDASYYIQEFVQNQGGKGGGRGEVFTGGFSEVIDSENLFENLRAFVRNRIRE